VFGEQVGWVAFAGDLAKVDPPQAYRLLYPQSVGIQVTQFAQPLA